MFDDGGRPEPRIEIRTSCRRPRIVDVVEEALACNCRAVANAEAFLAGRVECRFLMRVLPIAELLAQSSGKGCGASGVRCRGISRHLQRARMKRRS